MPRRRSLLSRRLVELSARRTGVRDGLDPTASIQPARTAPSGFLAAIDTRLRRRVWIHHQPAGSPFPTASRRLLGSGRHDCGGSTAAVREPSAGMRMKHLRGDRSRGSSIAIIPGIAPERGCTRTSPSSAPRQRGTRRSRTHRRCRNSGLPITDDGRPAPLGRRLVRWIAVWLPVLPIATIESTPGVCLPVLVRTRVPVWLLEHARRLGTSEAELLRSYPMSFAPKTSPTPGRMCQPTARRPTGTSRRTRPPDWLVCTRTRTSRCRSSNRFVSSDTMSSRPPRQATPTVRRPRAGDPPTVPSPINLPSTLFRIGHWPFSSETFQVPDLYSEDFQDGRLDGTVRARNPFV